ncbi:MAG TPA: DPP IV N-terminal domain-containing protein [Abditibacteriaceae bacterium]|jgi:TolB protein
MGLWKLAAVALLGTAAIAGCGGGNGGGLNVPSGNQGQIVFLSDRDQFGKFYSMDANGGNVKLLGDTAGNVSYPRFSYDGRKIAYIRRNNLWLMNSDGTGPQQVTQFKEVPFEQDLRLSPGAPSLSPDGCELVFTLETADSVQGNNEIWKINVNGSGLKRLTTNIREDTDPVWSPDGQNIVFYGYSVGREITPDSLYRIRLIDKDGNNERILTPAGVADSSPSFSRDGRQIVFQSSKGNSSGIWVMDVDGKNRRQVLALTGVIVSPNPAFSPDGRSIVFSASREITNNMTNQEIYSIGIDGKNERRLTNDPAVDTQPTWG